MAKIGILGGTFNPIHLGHINLAREAYNSLKLDKVLIMPTGLSYLKVDKNVLSKEVRSEMVKLAIKDFNYFEFSDLEIKKEGNTYTCETLQELHELYPGNNYYFIAGADTLFSIEKWKNPEIVLKLSTLAVMVRDDSNLLDIKIKAQELSDKFSTNIEILNCKKFDASSTMIREELSFGNYDKVKDILDTNVLKYIKDNRLYI